MKFDPNKEYGRYMLTYKIPSAKIKAKMQKYINNFIPFEYRKHIRWYQRRYLAKSAFRPKQLGIGWIYSRVG